MILVQKPAPFPTSSPLNIHRRHPSAPSPVVVQSTRTPGLLTLSKPLQQHQQNQQHQQRQRHSPKSKHSNLKTPARSAQQENPVALKPSPEIADRKPVAAPPAEKASTRGRQSAKSKDKPVTRSSSHSAVRGRRNNARQPSPPLPPALTSQAEATSTPYKSTSSNLFDPFMDDSPSVRGKFVHLAPTLVARPSGKLAKRRLTNNFTPANSAPTPASSPAKAVPVPRRNNSSSDIFSRSAPVPNHLHHRSTAKAMSEPPVFPICDDVSEAGDFIDSDSLATPPRTPTRSRSSAFLYGFNDGPRTAPITASTKSFPFNGGGSPTPAPAKKGRRHARVPSEGVFAMSSDEEVSTGGVGSAGLKSMNVLVPRRRPTVSMTESEKERAAAAAAAAAAYFASSNFQNSPSPEELPPPSFV